MFKERIKQLRENRQMLQGKLAEAMDIERHYKSKIKNSDDAKFDFICKKIGVEKDKQ
jgi:transcriptional regulator with XRE-family HTH domain